MTAYLLELPLARFNKYHLLFANYISVFVRVQIKNGNVLLLLKGLFISSFNIVSTRETKKFISSQNFPELVALKVTFAGKTKVSSYKRSREK